MSREMLAAAIMVWLLGALVGWFVGWVARGEQDRAWHHNLARQLAEARAQLDDALEQLDDARDRLGERSWQPQPASVHVHLPWTPVVVHTTGPTTALPAPVRALGAVPVVEEIEP